MEPKQRDLLKLRARLVVTERAALAALELALMLRPEDLEIQLAATRKRLAEGYRAEEFGREITDPEARAFLADEVDRYMEGLQTYLGLRQGSSPADEG